MSVIASTTVSIAPPATSRASQAAALDDTAGDGQDAGQLDAAETQLIGDGVKDGALVGLDLAIGKGGLYGNVIRTGVMLNSTTDTIDKLIAALDAGLVLCQ